MGSSEEETFCLRWWGPLPPAKSRQGVWGRGDLHARVWLHRGGILVCSGWVLKQHSALQGEDGFDLSFLALKMVQLLLHVLGKESNFIF